MVADLGALTATTTETYVLVHLTEAKPDFYVEPGDDLRRGVDERREEFIAK
jgi:hypothetical protein